LLGAFGLAAYYLTLSLGIADALLLTRHRITEPYLRLTGWLLSLVGFSALAAMAASRFSPGPVIGSGGYLGAAVKGLLELNFASVGAYILVLSLILGGLLLCTDYVVLRALLWIVAIGARIFGRSTANVVTAYARRLTARRPISEADEEVPDADSVRILSRKTKNPPVDEGEKEEKKPQEDAVSDAAAPLRVRNPGSRDANR